jgi:hypothetical protein
MKMLKAFARGIKASEEVQVGPGLVLACWCVFACFLGTVFPSQISNALYAKALAMDVAVFATQFPMPGFSTETMR